MTKVIKEIWKEVPGIDNLEVSNIGNVRKFKQAIHRKYYTVLKQYHKHGYMNVWFNYSRYFVHVLQGLAFISNPENKPFINHKDGIKDRNFVDNIEWNTEQENTYHSIYTLGYTTNFGKKKVRVLKNGEFVCDKPTVSEAARFAGGQSTQVSRVGTRTHYKGYTFEYLE